MGFKMNKFKKLSLPIVFALSFGSTAALAQFTVSPDAFKGGVGEAIDLSNMQFTKIPDVKNTTQSDAKQQLRDFVKNIKSATGQFAQQSGGGAQGKGVQSGTFSLL